MRPQQGFPGVAHPWEQALYSERFLDMRRRLVLPSISGCSWFEFLWLTRLWPGPIINSRHYGGSNPSDIGNVVESRRLVRKTELRHLIVSPGKWFHRLGINTSLCEVGPRRSTVDQEELPGRHRPVGSVSPKSGIQEPLDAGWPGGVPKILIRIHLGKTKVWNQAGLRPLVCDVLKKD